MMPKRNGATYKAVVVGCGRVGSLWDEERLQAEYPLTHAGALSRNSRIRLVGGADVDSARRERFAAVWKTKAYGNYQEMFAEVRPDWVSVCTPPETHLQVSLAAVEAGAKAIFCEKPIAVAVHEGRALVDACAQRGVVLAVGHQRRWDAGHQRVARWVGEGRIGVLQRAVGAYAGGINNNGSHLIDVVRMVVGEVREVRATSLGMGDGSDPSLDVDLTAGVGVPVTLIALRQSAYEVMELDIFGEKGRISLRDFGRDIRLYSKEPLAQRAGFHVLGRGTRFKGQPLDAALSNAVEDVVRCMDEGGTPLCTGTDGLGNLRVVEEARSQVRLLVR